MPNLIPDSVLGFELGWAQPAGRLIWSTLILVVMTAFVVALIKPPLPHRVLVPKRGVPLVIALIVGCYVIGVFVDALQVFMVWVALGGAALLSLLMVASRPPRDPDQPSTWAANMAGAVAVFFMMVLAYGVIPHEWITFADKYLQWTPDKLFIRTYPVDVTYEAVRDIVVVLIYVAAVGANLRLWVMWQERLTPKAEEEGEKKPSRLSRFGRPLRAKA
jgi:hypothetical protein